MTVNRASVLQSSGVSEPWPPPRLAVCFSFRWTERTLALGDGAFLIDLTNREIVDWIDCTKWLTNRLTAHQIEAAKRSCNPQYRSGSGQLQSESLS